ncbi:hypothetical protein [Archangium violaceum]|uniref:Uncharacterized protein n=1 Tax=Archangium violaceum Cb vi76 TaxID=1406225 RepID=A0A084SG04_9BACT|nr:hypothetical protein [Archangium violaceum]KFA87389.1 hypothetical protein Q664_47730 [Archangium violaceum Cb vi76]
MPLYAKLPDRVKPSELTMINPVWIDIQSNPKEFVPHKSVTFLWVMRGDGNVILGVEEPWRYKEAFDKSVWPMLEKMKQHYEAEAEYWKTQSIRDGSGGHPTLAAWFDPTGRASDHAGFAYIGGELRYDENTSQWVLTNQSGRFGRGSELKEGTVQEQDVLEALNGAAQRITEKTGLAVTIRLVKK